MTGLHPTASKVYFKVLNNLDVGHEPGSQNGQFWAHILVLAYRIV